MKKREQKPSRGMLKFDPKIPALDLGDERMVSREPFGPGHECGTPYLEEQRERERLLHLALKQKPGWVVVSPDLTMMLCLADGRPYIGSVWEARELAEAHNLYHIDAQEFIRLQESKNETAPGRHAQRRPTKGRKPREKHLPES